MAHGCSREKTNLRKFTPADKILALRTQAPETTTETEEKMTEHSDLPIPSLWQSQLTQRCCQQHTIKATLLNKEGPEITIHNLAPIISIKITSSWFTLTFTIKITSKQRRCVTATTRKSGNISVFSVIQTVQSHGSLTYKQQQRQIVAEAATTDASGTFSKQMHNNKRYRPSVHRLANQTPRVHVFATGWPTERDEI